MQRINTSYPLTKLCFFLVLSLLLSLCGKTKIVPEGKKVISKDELINEKFRVLSVDIKYPAGANFLFIKEVVEINMKFSCPDLPQNIGISLFLTDKLDSVNFSELETIGKSSENAEQKSQSKIITSKIFPQTFVCQKSYSITATAVVDAPTSGKYFMILYFFPMDSEFTIPTTEFSIIPVYLEEKQDIESHIFKRWYQANPTKIAGLIGLSIIEEDDMVKIFALTPDGIEILDFFPDSLSFTSRGKAPISVSSPVSIGTIRGDKASFIFIEAEGRLSEIFRYEANSLYPIGVTQGFAQPSVIFKHGEDYYLTYPNCGKVWKISKSGSIEPSDVWNCDLISAKGSKLFMFYRLRQGWHIKIFPDSSTNVGYSIISEEEDGFYFYDEYIYHKDNNKKVKLIDIYKLDLTGAISFQNRISMDVVSPDRTINYDSLLPLYKDKVLLISNTHDSTNNITVYVVNSTRIEVEKALPYGFYPFQLFMKKENIRIFALYGYSRMQIFLFDNEKLLLDYNSEFLGTPVDFTFDGKKLFIALKLSSDRLGFLTLEKKDESVLADFKFIPEIVERYKVFLFKPDFFFVFFTNSKGCWVQNVCRGDEFLYLRAGRLHLMEKFFSHQSPTLQSIAGIVFYKGDPLVLIRDRDRVKAFLRR